MRAWCVLVLALAAFGLAGQGCGGPGGGGDGGSDGGQDAGCLDPDGVAAWTQAPSTLSATGLYQGGGAGTLADGVRPFRPAYELWSDGAQKQRWVKLPGGCAIDTSDMDHWSVPVGTRLWKEFSVGGQKVETRLIARVAKGTSDDFLYATYQWNGAGTEAAFVASGVQNANGTAHDIPAVGLCTVCHGSLEEHVLGFSAIQLTQGASSEPGLTLSALAAEGLLTAAPAAGGYPVPGDAGTAAALGYLHANCGNCHHAQGIYFNNPFDLRLLVGQRTPEETSAYLTAVGEPVEQYTRPGILGRVVPGNPDASCVSVRMARRGMGQQMPPLATEQVDTAGAAVVDAWIRSLAQ